MTPYRMVASLSTDRTLSAVFMEGWVSSDELPITGHRLSVRGSSLALHRGPRRGVGRKPGPSMTVVACACGKLRWAHDAKTAAAKLAAHRKAAHA